MVTDEYELLPHEELERLRKEVDQLKRDPLQGMASSKTLIDAMDNLSHSINNLLRMLSDAQKDMIKEYQSAKPNEKLIMILEQNEKMAKALVSIANMVKRPPIRHPAEQQYPRPMQQMPRPQMHPPPVQHPQVQNVRVEQPRPYPELEKEEMPPPPLPPEEKKRGLFGFGK